MTITLSATEQAIAQALTDDTLVMSDRSDTRVALTCARTGLIEVAMDRAAAEARIASIRARRRFV